MENAKNRRVRRDATAGVEGLLEGYYNRLLKWATLLTRGDASAAFDIVQDLCLHFTLARPDLSGVANLDGYLYTCLRNIYLSMLARSSREAMLVVSTAEFDSIEFALSTTSLDDLLDRQNDLRRICSYAVWRKERSKSASYLILLFFHGYSRREVAAIARLPLAAIYNKLKVARTEVKSYLERTGRLHVATVDLPPEPELRLSVVSSDDLFSELREKIVAARLSDCLDEEALLAHYSEAEPKPVACGLLAHIVSCPRCLAVLRDFFEWPNLEDRQRPPDDGQREKDATRGDGIATHSMSFARMFRSVHRQREQVFEHRPRTLSIAVNGRIAASHDVQGAQSTLSSRIEQSGAVEFVEVFTEQQIRLAFVAISERPPEGPHQLTQRIVLSDDRWLELDIQIDGLGLQSEVTYFDPALAWAISEEGAVDNGAAIMLQERGAEVAVSEKASEGRSVVATIRERLRALTAMPKLAWAVAMMAVILATGAAFVYRHERSGPDARQLLSQSEARASEALRGHAEHQVLNIEEVAADGRTMSRGTVDLWQDSDGRSMRRLYDSRNQLVASEWRGPDGKTGSYLAGKGESGSDEAHALTKGGFWKRDLSAEAFRAMAGREIDVHASGDTYEVASVVNAESGGHVVSAVLTLDRNLRPISEVLRTRGDAGIGEVRLVQTVYALRPSASVPDSVFTPHDLEIRRPDDQGISALQGEKGHRMLMPSNLRIAQAQIAVFYELGRLGADVSEPIEIARTGSGHIRVSGTVDDEAKRREIESHLKSLPDDALIEVDLAAQSNLRAPSMRGKGHMSVYTFTQGAAPADAVLVRYFAARGWTSDRVNSAVAQFSQDALGHAQHALQHAYALERLGNAFSAAELTSVSPDAQRQWAEMVASHAARLESELQELNNQLAPVAPISEQSAIAKSANFRIESPVEFSRAAAQLLRQVQELNRSIGESFASGSMVKSEPDPDASVVRAVQAIPLGSARQMAGFASRLGDAAESANRENHFSNQHLPVPNQSGPNE